MHFLRHFTGTKARLALPAAAWLCCFMLIWIRCVNRDCGTKCVFALKFVVYRGEIKVSETFVILILYYLYSDASHIVLKKSKDRPAARTLNVVFVAVSHYQSLQIVVLLLQACLLGSLALSRTSLLQKLHRLQQDRRFRLFASLFSSCLKTDSVASCLRER